MRRIYLDSGALITAMLQSTSESERHLWEFFAEGDSAPLSSVAVRLETVPMAAFNRRAEQLTQLERFFAASDYLPVIDARLLNSAEALAIRYGLHAMDALHVASAIRLRATELLTTEKQTRRIHAVRELKIVSLSSLR